MAKEQTQASGLRIVMMVVVILVVIPAATILFGLYGFLAGLVALLLVALAEKDKTTI